MSDIEFLSIKEFDGKVVTNTGARVTNGTLATLTANTGKDMYLGKAKVTLLNDSGVITEAIIALVINGVTKESVKIGSGNVSTTVYEYVLKGLKVLTGETMRLEVTNALNSPEINGTLECFEEDTGQTPQISSI